MSDEETVKPEVTLTWLDDSFTQANSNGRAPGLYLSDPQGHALLVGEHRQMTVMDLGGVIEIAGIDVWDADVVDRFADRLHMLAGRLRKRQANPYHPGKPLSAEEA